MPNNVTRRDFLNGVALAAAGGMILSPRELLAHGSLPHQERVYSECTSLFFKHTHVFRIVDKKRNTLVYLAISDKIIEGSPQNSISSVPIERWPQ